MSRKKNNFLHDVMDVATHLPWYVGILLAGLSYLAFHYMAGIEIPKADGMDDIQSVLLPTIVKTGSRYLQYLIPVLLILGSALSVIEQFLNRQMFDSVADPKNRKSLKNLSWREFERLLNEAFKRQGYRVIETPPGADGGVDLKIKKDAETFYVQAKHWKSKSIGVKVVRELAGVITAGKVTGGIVVGSGNFTTEALKFAQKTNIKLIDGNSLRRMIGKLKNHEVTEIPNSPKSPRCPECNETMVLRTAKRGANPGQQFWGCSTYPKCRGTRQNL